MAAPKLYYFDAAGRAEMIRLAFHIGGIPFEDIRIPKEEWPQYKPKSPSGQVPFVEFEDGTILVESVAILLYASKRAGLVPSDPLQLAYAEQCVSLVENMAGMIRVLMDPNADKDATVKTLLEKAQTADRIIGKTQSPEGYVIGSQLSFADLFVYCILSKALRSFFPDVVENIMKTCPHMKKICEVTEAHPEIKKYYA